MSSAESEQPASYEDLKELAEACDAAFTSPVEDNIPSMHGEVPLRQEWALGENAVASIRTTDEVDLSASSGRVHFEVEGHKLDPDGRVIQSSLFSISFNADTETIDHPLVHTYETTVEEEADMRERLRRAAEEGIPEAEWIPPDEERMAQSEPVSPGELPLFSRGMAWELKALFENLAAPGEQT